jgi:hypothetical protein
VDRIPERVEDGRNLKRNVRRVTPDVRHRKYDVFGERARAIYAHSLRMGTQMTSARETIAAAAADDMTFSADTVADLKVCNVRTDFHDLTYKLMSYNQRDRNSLLRP